MISSPELPINDEARNEAHIARNEAHIASTGMPLYNTSTKTKRETSDAS